MVKNNLIFNVNPQNENLFYFLGECICKGNTLIKVPIKPRERSALVKWSKPEYECASGGKVTDEKLVTQPDWTSPRLFSRGNYKITYTYTLNGAISFKCPVKIDVFRKLNNRKVQTGKEK